MFSVGLFIFVVASATSQQIFKCDFDYGANCLEGLPLESFVLLNESSSRPQLPASDVTSIQTSNEQGECFFPFVFNTFEMFFCLKTDVNLPSTCPIQSPTGPKINCSDGSYGLETFQENGAGHRSYKLDVDINLAEGEHCLQFYYFLSGPESNGTVGVILQDSQSHTNTTILQLSNYTNNRWQRIRHQFSIYYENPTIYFQFYRSIPQSPSPFYIAVDDIVITDLQCEPDITLTTTTTARTSTVSATSTSTTTSGLDTTTTRNLSTTRITTATSSLPITTTPGSSATKTLQRQSNLLATMLLMSSYLLIRHG